MKMPWAKSGWRQVSLYAATAVLSVLFLVAGVTKCIPLDEHVVSFERWGYPLWFLYAVGFVEVVLALGLVWRRTAILAAPMLAVLMLGATATHLVHAEWAMAPVPLALAAVLGLITYAYREQAVRAWQAVRTWIDELWAGGWHGPFHGSTS